MKGAQRAIALLTVLLLSASALVLLWFDPLETAWRSAGATAAVVILCAALITLLSTLDRRSPALLRLDWFLPVLRRTKPGQQIDDRFAGRLMRRVVPKSFRSDYQTKRRGYFRKFVRKLGISWLASPVRRVSQAICLLTFLVLFFYVCWPYTAKPLPPGEVSTGWRFEELSPETGEVVFAGGSIVDWMGLEGASYLQPQTDVGADLPATKVALTKSSKGRIALLPAESLPDSILDLMLVGDSLWSVYQRPPDAWPSHYADELASKEVVSADLFLAIDPLVSLSTAIASRSWVWSLVSAAAILLVCILIPRGFCGYICPLGTTIDLFDWAVTRRTRRFEVPGDGWWVHIKYYLLAGVLVAAVMGVLLSGFVAAIPVITRAMLFIGEPLQSGSLRGWHLVPDFNAGHLVSIFLFMSILCLGFMRPRFWCKYVCPSGAVFSIGNLFRVTQRKVESSCIHCNKCVEICPFDAIKPDFTTRETDCTMCQSCGGVCPTHAIKFVERWNVVELKVADDPPTGETSIGRRGFLSLAAGSAAAVTGGVVAAGATKGFGADAKDRPVRPPGSVPEDEFLEMCIRCGECFKVCPNNVLQPQSFQQGLEGLWTPRVEADWAGCESSCNACGQVCPTGAIRPLPLEEKKVARMGLAIVNESTCLPFAGREDCDLCVLECQAAGYNAIEYIQVGTQVDDQGRPIEGTGMLAPRVIDDECVGCGLCQTRCYGINVKERGVLSHSAIIVETGPGKEDRLMTGSYRQLRDQREASKRKAYVSPAKPNTEKPEAPSVDHVDLDSPEDDNPFGL